MLSGMAGFTVWCNSDLLMGWWFIAVSGWGLLEMCNDMLSSMHGQLHGSLSQTTIPLYLYPTHCPISPILVSPVWEHLNNSCLIELAHDMTMACKASTDCPRKACNFYTNGVSVFPSHRSCCDREMYQIEEFYILFDGTYILRATFLNNAITVKADHTKHY